MTDINCLPLVGLFEGKTPSLDADVAANLGEIAKFAAASRGGHACVYVLKSEVCCDR